jgi:hypothetical protein
MRWSIADSSTQRVPICFFNILEMEHHFVANFYSLFLEKKKKLSDEK